jgi:DNA-binding response OmpR family regulator
MDMDVKRTIAVVDDNPDIMKILKAVLENKGFSVLCASSGEEMFDLLEEHRPDLIILDIMMPKMDGMEVLTRLRQNPETSSIRVILMTAKNKYEDVLNGYGLGTDYYLTKPFTSSQLLNGINLVLNEHQR